MVHKLEGVPEILSLGDLLSRRNNPSFDVLRVPPHQTKADLLVGGDVMLGRSVGEQIQTGADSFAGIARYLNAAPWKFVNLECVVFERAKRSRESSTPFGLRSKPPEFSAAQINAVGLANNHAGDFGSDALIDTITRLHASDIAVLGAAKSANLAYAPHFSLRVPGKRRR